MDDLIDSLTRGNPTEVKVVLATVALALAVYQLVVIAIAYGKLRPSFLAAAPAALAHRAVGDTIAVLLVATAAICVAYYGFEDDAGLHVAAASALLVALAAKILVVRRFRRLGRLLPALGASIWVLLALTWLTSAGDFLADR